MATEKFTELQGFSEEDLLAELTATEAEYQKMKFDNVLVGLESPIALREVRRDIARMKTEVRRRELVAMSDAQLAKRSKIRARRKK